MKNNGHPATCGIWVIHIPEKELAVLSAAHHLSKSVAGNGLQKSWQATSDGFGAWHGMRLWKKPLGLNFDDQLPAPRCHDLCAGWCWWCCHPSWGALRHEMSWSITDIKLFLTSTFKCLSYHIPCIPVYICIVLIFFAYYCILWLSFPYFFASQISPTLLTTTMVHTKPLENI